VHDHGRGSAVADQVLIAVRDGGAVIHRLRSKGSAMQIPGFDYQRVTVADGVALNVAAGGSGPPIVLLHGFPQTHLMWRHVAADLAADHTVICPDLRGYGDSDKPAEVDEQTYSQRTMAADIVALAAALGPGPRTSTTARSPAVTSWPRKPRRRGQGICGP
jgi:pimeloyl-ACP methyl ester carboxylesterase